MWRDTGLVITYLLGAVCVLCALSAFLLCLYLFTCHVARRNKRQRGKRHLPRSLSLALALARSRRGCQKSCPCRSTPEAAGRAEAILARLEEMSR